MPQKRKGLYRDHLGEGAVEASEEWSMQNQYAFFIADIIILGPIEKSSIKKATL
jgi:hypothetical protein